MEFLHALVAQFGLAMGNAQRLELQHESVRRLTELARLRASLIGGVSHELRTPLTAMMGLAQTLRTRDLPTELRTEFLDQILRQARRLNVLVAWNIGVILASIDSNFRPRGAEKIPQRPTALSAASTERNET